MEKRTFERVEPVSKKARVIVLLKDAILSGAIQSGEQIVEGKIAQEFGVGQGLIREALIELEHQGFVQRTPFSGTQVPTLSREDAEQIFDIRIELEPLAFTLAGPKTSAQQLTELDELVAQARQGAENGDLNLFFENHLSFRRKVWERTENKYLQQTLEHLVVPLYALYLIRGSSNRQGLLQTAIECVEHQEKIMETFRTSDFKETKRVVREFLVRMRKNLGSKLLPTT